MRACLCVCGGWGGGRVCVCVCCVVYASACVRVRMNARCYTMYLVFVFERFVASIFHFIVESFIVNCTDCFMLLTKWKAHFSTQG